MQHPGQVEALEGYLLIRGAIAVELEGKRVSGSTRCRDNHQPDENEKAESSHRGQLPSQGIGIMPYRTLRLSRITVSE